MIVDFHVHLFGVGHGDTGCQFSDVQRRHWNYRYLRGLLGLKENGRTDQDYLDGLVRQVRASSVRKAVLQAWDCRYDADGEQDLDNTTSLYVPNDYLFRVVKEFPDLFVACASINPKRADWKEEVNRCARPAPGRRSIPDDGREPRRGAVWHCRRCAENS
jgi:predicted TIM-barrel fold metal-dependent hydrolase